LRDPVRPVDLGLSSDPRRLGLQLRSLTVQTPKTGITLDTSFDALRKLRRRLMRSLRN
jgi:hypothetical protein